MDSSQPPHGPRAGDAESSHNSAHRAPRGPRKQRPAGSHLPLQAQPGGGSKANMKRIRDLKRLLNKGDIPATVRADMEKELRALSERRGEKKVKARRADMISRYHMVRFFERKKAERKLKRARKELETAEDPEEKSRLQQEVVMFEVDIAYTQYFPHLEPYVSLWPNSKDAPSQPQDKQAADDSDDDDALAPEGTLKRLGQERANKPEMWHTIEQAMSEGTAALEKIRDRKGSAGFLMQQPLPMHGPRASLPSQDKSFGKAQPSQKREKGRKNEVQRKGNWEDSNDVDMEDDGEGFFE